METERRREKRYKSSEECSIFLSDGPDGLASSASMQGKLQAISFYGAGIILPAILIDRLHLAYAPQESETLTLQLSISPSSADKTLTIPCKMRWYNKKLDNEPYPFCLGLEFLTPLSTEQLKIIRGKK